MASEIERIGLSPLYSPAEGQPIIADIVVVHGLFGHPHDTWTFTNKVKSPQNTDKSISKTLESFLTLSFAKKEGGSKGKNTAPIASDGGNTSPDPPAQGAPPPQSNTQEPQSHQGHGIFWPKDLLPKALPNVRIFTYGYDVDIVKAFQSTSHESVYQHAFNLLNDLANVRTEEAERARRLIFITHSLGGVVVKQALVQSYLEKTALKDIYLATSGVCFLGTPHRGSDPASMGKIAFETSKVFFRQPNIQVLRTLEVNSSELEQIAHSFSQICGEVNIHSFAETHPTKHIMVVPNFSYSTGLAQETISSIPSSHSDMTKFSSSSDPGFTRVVGVLKRWLRGSAARGGFDDKELCLESLNIPLTRDRIAGVEKTFGDTYKWIFEDQVPFEEWLRNTHSNEIFWIQGKPGSGKSTLMKFALHHYITRMSLSLCDSRDWIIAGFFFHDRGRMVQKSISGLLCEVLYQILRRRRDLIPHVLPIFLQNVRVREQVDGNTEGLRWLTQDLGDALHNIVFQRDDPLNLCLFIDALDEHSGDQRELLKIFAELASSKKPNSVKLKLCVASRQENIFKTAFENCPTVIIHDHTERDIEIYASGRMQEESACDPSQEGATELRKKLVEDVRKRAQGVFIWVQLVMDELIQTLGEGASLEDLQEVLSGIPTKLEELYQRTLLRIEKRNSLVITGSKFLHEAYVMFEIALCCRKPYPLATFINATTVVVSGSVQATKLDELRRPIPTPEMKRQLVGRCGGLLETVTGSQFHATGERDVVQFIHQTAKEFIGNGTSTRTLIQRRINVVPENGHILLVRFGIRVIRLGLDMRIPDFLYHAWKAEQVSGVSNAEELNTLIRHDGQNPFRDLEVLFSEINIDKSFQKLRTGTRDALFWMLLTAVYGNLIHYLRKTWKPTILKQKDFAARLIVGAAQAAITGAYETGVRATSDIVIFLLQHGVKADSTVEGSPTPLQIMMASSFKPNLDNEDIDGDGNDGGRSSYTEILNIVEALLKHGADPNTYKSNPVISAMKIDQESMVRLLLEYGAKMPSQQELEATDRYNSHRTQWDAVFAQYDRRSRFAFGGLLVQRLTGLFGDWGLGQRREGDCRPDDDEG